MEQFAFTSAFLLWEIYVFGMNRKFPIQTKDLIDWYLWTRLNEKCQKYLTLNAIFDCSDEAHTGALANFLWVSFNSVNFTIILWTEIVGIPEFCHMSLIWFATVFMACFVSVCTMISKWIAFNTSKIVGSFVGGNAVGCSSKIRTKSLDIFKKFHFAHIRNDCKKDRKNDWISLIKTIDIDWPHSCSRLIIVWQNIHGISMLVGGSSYSRKTQHKWFILLHM